MIVGPRYNDVDPAVEAAYERAAEAETTTSKLDAIAARLEAIGAGVEISGSQLAVLMDDAEQLLAVVREVGEIATDLEHQPPFGATSEEQWSMDTERAVARDLRRIIAPLTKEETDGR